MNSPDSNLLEVEGLKVHFPLRGSFAERLLGREAGSVKAVDGISFQLRRGEVLGLVGESGSGKTTLGRTMLRLVEPTDGSIVYDGRDITRLSDGDMRGLRRKMQIVFQDPHASLNPAMDLETAVGHPLKIHGIARDKSQIRRRVAEMLERVGLAPAERFLSKYPGDLSGGQKQRAVLARAIILNPDLLVADEPVSMLDMSVRAKILELMGDLKDEFDLTYLYITHDLATARFFCDRIAIMYLGRIVELGPAEDIYANPRHPYTASLLKAIPEPDPAKAIPRDLPRGEVPDAVTPPHGCNFHPRCPRAFEVCGWEARDVRDLLEERWAGMEPDAFVRENRIVPNLDALDEVSETATVPAGEDASGGEVAELLERVRAEEPDARIWKGVREIRAVEGAAAVQFHEAIEPRHLAVDGVEVECHLYDEDAKRRAAEYAAEAAQAT
ncbi:MAG TPA: oligopeptide/dipeptide ABC transporter ATP-binding protein [Gaiellaceae bacterium]|nr:oligopeptide/dipeptide ABC transporter ATP-binding protein [Gaiellaceae bacterium]